MPNQRTDPLSRRIDQHVGSRIRVRRKELRLSQTQLADALGLTFQQVQKYEAGSNRVAASTLWAIADYLRVEVSYFFDGLAKTPGEGDDSAAAKLSATIQTFLNTPEGLELAKIFPTVHRGDARRQVLSLVKVLSLLPGT